MNALSSSVIEPLVWFTGGFLGGVLATYLILSKLAQTSRLEHPMATPDPPTTTKPKRRFTALHVIGVCMLVLTILSAIQAAIAQRANTRLQQENARTAACLVTYANAIADAFDIRSKASLEAQKAQVQVWLTIFQQPTTDEGRATSRRVFEDWLKKQQTSIQTQQTNPYPAPPRAVCPDSGG